VSKPGFRCLSQDRLCEIHGRLWEATSSRRCSSSTLSAGFAGLTTALAFAAGIALQPIPRRASHPLAGNAAGPVLRGCRRGAAVVAVAGADRVLAAAAAVLFRPGRGLCLVSGLRQAEQMALLGERRGGVTTRWPPGFTAPHLADGLGAASGKAGAVAVLTGIAVLVAAWTVGYALRLRRTDGGSRGQNPRSPQPAPPRKRGHAPRPVRDKEKKARTKQIVALRPVRRTKA
jgi:hypothetical protein